MKIATKRRQLFFSDVKVLFVYPANSTKWLSLIYKTMRFHFRNNFYIKKMYIENKISHEFSYR